MTRVMDAIRTGFWFLPTVMLLAAAGLALLLLHIDHTLDPGTEAKLKWAYSGGPEGARSLLSTIAGSMITAASVTFSLASVALSIASQQYGSRVLRNFMRDRITQILLGTFVSTFIYSVLVVREIRGSDIGGGFVPAISVTAAIALSLASLVLLVYFIHHVSASIQASHIIRVIAQDLEAAVPRLYPDSTGRAPLADEPAKAPDPLHTTTIRASKSGYLQTIDLDTLMQCAQDTDACMHVQVEPGDHLLDGALLVRVEGQRSLSKHSSDKIRDAFFLDRQRTPAQDIRYHFQQLTDVVVRALSPGINDPFTAINGIDELASSMLTFLKRGTADPERKDKDGHLRLVVPSASAAEILEATVGHIALYAASDRFVMNALRRLLDAVVPVLSEANALERVGQLRAQLDKLQRMKAAS